MSGKSSSASFSADYPEEFADLISAFPPKLAAAIGEHAQQARTQGLPDQSLGELSRLIIQSNGKQLIPAVVFDCFFRLATAARNPISFVSFLQHDKETVRGLTRLFRTAPTLSEYLIADPEVLELLRITGGHPVDAVYLQDEITAECISATSPTHARSILRRFHQRETLRIAYGDLIAGVPVDRTGQQLSYVADAILAAAIEFTRKQLLSKKPLGSPTGRLEPRLAIIALGAFGGQELSFSRRLDVLFISPDFLPSDPEQQACREFTEQWVETIHSLLEAADGEPALYELHSRIQFPQQTAGSFQLTEWVRAFETSGRTWQRLALVKARFSAGNGDLAEDFLNRITPWVYRRYLWAFDQAGIRSLKRKLVKTPQTAEEHLSTEIELRDTINEVIDVLQLLQLLNGSDVVEIRVTNTFRAIEMLEQAGCLTMQERSLLIEHLTALKRLEMRIQIADSVMEVDDRWALIATSLDFVGPEGTPDARSLLTEFHQRRTLCRRIMDHLVHEVFSDVDEIPFETEMILDPDVDVIKATNTLRNFSFQHPETAWQHLLSLATEPIRFLSDRRARHFLAGIAPKLLEELSTTPFPDSAIERLVAVSDSLGGKAALWELFQTTPSTLRLGVRLCAASPYLTNLLTNNPGMLDELLDSLVLDRLPTEAELEENSIELCRFAEEIDPIVHSFKDSAHLRIGVRDCLGRDPIQETHRRLAATAESCLRRITEDELRKMSDRYGTPTDSRGKPCALTIVALGRLGGREPNYHSDLDVVFLYDADGMTKPSGGARREGTTNSHFFNELTQRLHQRIGNYGNLGRLYELDSRIRFSPHRGLLAITVDQFQQHYASANCPLWERLALVNARVIFSTPDSMVLVSQLIRQVLISQAWLPHYSEQVAQLRYASQQGASVNNLKRGVGGTMDIEAIVQMLLLIHARHWDGELACGTLEGLEKLRANGFIEVDVAQQLSLNYRYLRSVESNLRLMDLPARHDVPQSAEQLRWLAYTMRESHPQVVVEKCDRYRQTNRQLFKSIIERTRTSGGNQRTP